MKQLIINYVLVILLLSVTAGVSAQYQNYRIDRVALNGSKRPVFEEVSIYRLQIRVKTGTMKHAGTDSPVKVKMNEEDHFFFLNLSKNDREKGKTDTYDILSLSIEKIKDIQFLTIEIDGEDAWYIKELEILVNNNVIYEKYFSGKAGWIEWGGKKANKITIKRKLLRQNRKWNYNNITKNIHKAPSSIPAEMIEAQMEALTGNSLHYTNGFSWGKKYGSEYVSVKKKNRNTVHVDLDLKNSGGIYFPDLEVDVDFDIQFTCKNGKIKASYKNLEIGTSTVGDYVVISSRLKEALTGDLPNQYRFDILGLLNIQEIYDFDFDYSRSKSGQNTCSESMKVHTNGDLLLSDYQDERTQVVKSKRGKRPRIVN